MSSATPAQPLLLTLATAIQPGDGIELRVERRDVHTLGVRLEAVDCNLLQLQCAYDCRGSMRDR